MLHRRTNFLQDINKIFVNLVSQYFAKSTNIHVLWCVFFDCLYNSHNSVHYNFFYTILMWKICVHVLLHRFNYFIALATCDLLSFLIFRLWYVQCGNEICQLPICTDFVITIYCAYSIFVNININICTSIIDIMSNNTFISFVLLCTSLYIHFIGCAITLIFYCLTFLRLSICDITNIVL